MHKILAFVIGTRPEAIKLAPVIRCALNDHNASFKIVVITTGQHPEPVGEILKIFSITPDYKLEIHRAISDSLSLLQSQIQNQLEELFINLNPDIVIIQGDTISTYSGAMAAFYQKIQIAHVEAGLRTGDIYSPHPEEGFRKMISQIATWHFTPTKKATDSLKNENIFEDFIIETGNTGIDALNYVMNNSELISSDNLTLDKDDMMILVTMHRRENWDKIDNIIDAVDDIICHKQAVKVVWVTHPNPQLTEKVVQRFQNNQNVDTKFPLKYQDMVHLMKRAFCILTDSGGIQEEAPSINVPVLVARDSTERIEGIDAGCSKLVGTSKGGIVDAITELIDNRDEYKKMTHINNPYGDGLSSQRILNTLK